MKIDIQSIHFHAGQALLDFITAKAQKMEHHFAHIIHTEVFLKVEKPEADDNKVVEIRVHIPGNTLFAKEQCDSFEEATLLAVDSVTRQLDKTKQKLQSA
ncbi:MAG: raiA [Sphingobacteriaceae bacterium]|jgi:putative sigma-54 modulation protein|nr:raiA [Sphingobacteriaceae bacterium]